MTTQHKNHTKKSFLRKSAIIVSFILTIVAVYFTYLDYSLNRREALKHEDPLIQYNFSDERRAFVVSSGSDIEIREVTWIMPSAYNSVTSRLNKHPRALTLKDLSSQLFDDSFKLNNKLTLFEHRNIIRCLILSKYSGGIPLIANVKFRQRGDDEIESIESLLYAQWITSDNPFIDVYKLNVTKKQKENFLTKAARDLRERFDIIKQVNISSLVATDGKCRESQNNFLDDFLFDSAS